MMIPFQLSIFSRHFLTFLVFGGIAWVESFDVEGFCLHLIEVTLVGVILFYSRQLSIYDDNIFQNPGRWKLGMTLNDFQHLRQAFSCNLSLRILNLFSKFYAFVLKDKIYVSTLCLKTSILYLLESLTSQKFKFFC